MEGPIEEWFRLSVEKKHGTLAVIDCITLQSFCLLLSCCSNRCNTEVYLASDRTPEGHGHRGSSTTLLIHVEHAIMKPDLLQPCSCQPSKVNLIYSVAVTFENSPFSSFVSQNIGFESMKPCLTHPSCFTWYRLM